MRKIILATLVVGFHVFGAQAARLGTEVLLTCREDARSSQALEVLLVKNQGKTYLLSSLNDNPILLRRTSLSSFESSNTAEKVVFKRMRDLTFELQFNQNSYLLNCELAVQ